MTQVHVGLRPCPMVGCTLDLIHSHGTDQRYNPRNTDQKETIHMANPQSTNTQQREANPVTYRVSTPDGDISIPDCLGLDFTEHHVVINSPTNWCVIHQSLVLNITVEREVQE